VRIAIRVRSSNLATKGKAELNRLPQNMLVVLCGYGNVDPMEGRVDDLTGLNLRCSIDQF